MIKSQFTTSYCFSKLTAFLTLIFSQTLLPLHANANSNENCDLAQMLQSQTTDGQIFFVSDQKGDFEKTIGINYENEGINCASKSNSDDITHVPFEQTRFTAPNKFLPAQ